MQNAGLIALGYVLVVNLASFLLFGWDKRCARLGRQRIPETRLLMFASVGGSIGAKVGQRWFRHKTYKRPFKTYLNVIVVLQICLLLLVTWMVLQPLLSG